MIKKKKFKTEGRKKKMKGEKKAKREEKKKLDYFFKEILARIFFSSNFLLDQIGIFSYK
jgi:hypothetical protein